MDYAKSGGWEIGVVIKRCEWVEGTEIRDQSSDIGVGMGSNTNEIARNIITCLSRGHMPLSEF